MVRMYEENEVHQCENCGMAIKVTFAAVPIDPISCCGKVMKFLGIEAGEIKLPLEESKQLENTVEDVYELGQVFTCSICGIEVTIIQPSQPIEYLDCCGEGMELMS